MAITANGYTELYLMVTSHSKSLPATRALYLHQRYFDVRAISTVTKSCKVAQLTTITMVYRGECSQYMAQTSAPKKSLRLAA